MRGDLPPATPEAEVKFRGPTKIPVCGACRGRLQSADQWRCPYTVCRAWLRVPQADGPAEFSP